MERVIERETVRENKIRHMGRQKLKEAQRQKRFICLYNSVFTVKSSLCFIDKAHHFMFSLKSS